MDAQENAERNESMKRRIISLLMALVMILGLVPTAVWAEDAAAKSAADGVISEHGSLNGGADAENSDAGEGGNAAVPGDGSTTAPEDGDTAAAPEGGVALLSDETVVASVTINGETTEYSNIFRAFESVKKVNSATITLLDDVYLPEDEDERFQGFPGKIEFESSGSVTLDLNGHMLTQADIGFTDGYTPNVIEMLYGTLTITGKGTIYQRYKTSAVSVSSQSIVTIDSDDVTIKADFTYGSHQFPTDSSRAIAVNGGTLAIKGGSFEATSGVALEYTEGTVVLSGGTFNGIKIATYKYPGKINEGVTITDLLAPGHTYQHSDGTDLTDYYVQNISDVKVVKGLTPVPYVDENGVAATVTNYIQLEPDTTQWNGGVYVAKGNVTINGGVTVSGKMPSIILCDRASLTINGGVTLPDGRPEALTIYGQTGGTGKMTVTNKSGAAFSCEGLAVLRLLNGMLTATGKETAFSDVITWNQLGYGNDEIKCIETGSDPEVRADGTAVPSVTLSHCTEHQWGYAQHASAEQHLKTCALCGYNPNGAGKYENCVYDSVSSLGEGGHKSACLCGRIQPGAALTKHTPDYIPNPDGKTHGYRCTVCDFVSDATEDQHTYVDGKCSLCGYACPHDDADKTIGSKTEGLCANCGKQVYEARLVRDNGKVLEYYKTVEEALARYTQVSDSIVTMLCDKDVGSGALVVTYEISGKELDLGGHTLSGSGDAVFQINKRYGFTLHNGTVKNTGDGDAIQLIHGIDPNWGGAISDGELTVEDITVTAAKGWAIQVADDASYADLNVKSGTFTGGLNAGTVSGGHKVKIYGGTFIANPDTHSVYYPGSSLTDTMLIGRLKDMLADGLTYGDADGRTINYFAAENRTIIGKSQYNYPEGVYLNAETVTIVEHASHPIDRETGKCSICGAPCGHIETDGNGLCTACGARIMFCEAEGKLYKTIQTAQTVLQDRTDNPTIKLLADYWDNVSLLGTENGYTLDLNGFRVGTSPVIMLEGRILTITDSSEAKTGGLTELQISGGTAYLQGGSYAELAVSHGTIKITGEDTVKITKSIEMPGKFIASGEYSNDLKVADMLNTGYAFYLVDENAGTETLVNGYRNVSGQPQQYLPGPSRNGLTLKDGQYYTVKAHTHDFADSNQTTCACGKTCTHDSVGADGVCAGCGKVFTAKVTDDKGNMSYYADGYYPDSGNTRSGLDFAFAAAATGSTVMVLNGDSATAYLDGGKDLTLELGGKSVDTIYVGRSEGVNSLTVTGTGNIRSLYVHEGNTTDLTGWAGKVEQLYVYSGGKATLRGGTFDKVVLNGKTAGSLLVSGYAFRYEDGSYVPYGATDDLTKTVFVVRCDFEGWYGSDDSAVCPYCAQTGAIQVPVTVDGTEQYAFYLTLQKAVDDANRSDSSTTPITLLQSISGDCAIDSDVSIDTKGCDINGALTVTDAEVSFSGKGSTVTAVTMSGSKARFGLIGRGGVTPVMGTLTIADGADWGSILPPGKPDRRGYKLQKDNGYEWRDSDTADADVSTMTNVSIQRLPIPNTSLKMLVDGKATIGTEIETPVQFVASCGTGTTANVVFYLQKEGSETIITLTGKASSVSGYTGEQAFTEAGKYTVWFEATRDGYTARSEKCILNISKHSIPAEEITPPTPYTGLVYNGEEQELIEPGRLDPKYGTIVFGDIGDQYYEFSTKIPKAKNAGDYKFYYLIRGSENYAGTTFPGSIDITIAKRELSVADVAVMEKVYDGTNEATFGEVTFGNALDSETPGYEASGVYSDCNAGDNKTIDVKVALRGNSHRNYMFADGKDATTFQKVGLSVAKAPAPDAETASLTVTNTVEKTYTITLPDIPAAPRGSYGAVTYRIGEVALENGYYTGGASVSGDGKTLTLPINAVDSRTEGVIGTVTVRAVTTNYEDILLTVHVSAKNKIASSGLPSLSNEGTITYGQKVGDIRLSGFRTAGLDPLTVVRGTYAWDDSDVVPAVGDGSYLANWIFTPEDQENYEIAHGTSLIKVEKAPLTVTAEDKSVVFGADVPAFTVKYDGFVNGEGEAVLGGELSFDCAYQAGSSVKEGGYAITPKGLTSGNYEITFAAGTLTAEQADAEILMEPKACGGLIYNGSQQQLIDAGRAAGDAKLVYSLSKDGPYRAEIPCGQDAGAYTVWYKVDGGSNYKDTEPASLTTAIGNAELTSVSVKQEGMLTYNGGEQRAAIAAEAHAAGGKQVAFTYSAEKNGTYTTEVPAFVTAGKHTVYFKANAAFHKEAAGQFEVTIGQLDIKGAEITLGQTLTYNGREQTQTITSVKVGSLTLKAGTDYSVDGNTGTDVKDEGYTLTVTGMGNYTGMVSRSFTISPKFITGAVVTLGEKLIYNGREQTQIIASVQLADGTALTDGDYTVSENTGIDAKTYTLTVAGKGNYTGTVKQGFTIARKDIADAAVTLVNKLRYTGEAQLPEIASVTVDSMTLNDGTDYTAAANNAVSAGEYSLTLTGKGNFAGTARKTFTIGKADALTVMPIAVDVTNGHAAVYTVDLATVLNGVLPAGCRFGTVNYEITRINDTLGYCSRDEINVDSRGILALAVNQVASSTEGRVGEVTVTAKTGNYQDMILTVELTAVNKTVPTGAPKLSKTTLAYDEALRAIRLSGIMRDGGTVVRGTFTWAEPDLRPAAGAYTATWVFTPDDGRYAVITGTANITVAQPPQTVPVYSVGGTVIEYSVNDPSYRQYIQGAVVTIRKGMEILNGRQLTDKDGVFQLKNVLAGVYNVVVEYQGKTVTTKVVLTTRNIENMEVAIPREDINSELEIGTITGLTRDTVVGGLDEEAKRQFASGSGTPDGASVSVSMDVKEVADNAQDQAQKAIREQVKGKNMDFMELCLLLTKNGSRTQLTETGTVLEIILSYDTSREDITVARYHTDGNDAESVTVFTQEDTRMDGTFFIDAGNKCIHIFASRFSTYAIGYTPVPDDSHGVRRGGGGAGSTEMDDVTSADTGDLGLLPYAAMALSACSGAAALRYRRKRED